MEKSSGRASKCSVKVRDSKESEDGIDVDGSGNWMRKSPADCRAGGKTGRECLGC